MTFLQITLVTFLLLKLSFELILAILNLKKIKLGRKILPESVSDYMSTEKWQKCSDYTSAKINLSCLENLFSFLLSLAVLFYFIPNFYEFWSFSFGFGILEASVLIATFLLILQQLELPFDWYRQFRLEQGFGFNKQTFRLWLTDKMKEFLLGAIFLTLVILLIHGLYSQISALLPKYWWIVACFTLFFFQLTMMVLWPRFVIPLFNTLKPLDDTDLRDKLNLLSDKTGFKTKEIQVIDGSKRSGHSNAFFTGFGRFRKIVLYDTLIKQMNHNEIISVVAHEIGHYKLGHIPKRLALSLVLGLFFFWFLDFLLGAVWFTEQLNIPSIFSGQIGPVLLAFILFGGCFTYWLTPIFNFLSRENEFQADDYAVLATGTPEHLSSALKGLSVENLSYPLPHPWVSFFHHSHPSLPERNLNIFKNKTNLRSPTNDDEKR